MSLLSRMAFWKRPTDEATEQMALARLMEELILHPTPYMAQGGTQPSATSLLRSITGAAAIATRVISDRISGLELQVVASRKARNGKVENMILDDHPLKALLDVPSQWFSARQLKRLIAQHLATVGEAYLAKITNGQMVPTALQPLPPDRVEPVGNGFRIDGYQLTASAGTRIEKLRFEEVCRIWQPDPEAMFSARGTLGPQSRLANMLEYSEEHLRNFYERDATPQAVFEAASPDAQAPKDGALERFQASWLKAYHARRGLKRGNLPFVAPGWTAKILDPASTLIGTRDLMTYARDAIMMAYGVPRSIVGDVVDANRATAETNAYVFDLHTVTPLADAITDAFTRDLAAMYPQNSGVKLSVQFADFVASDKQFKLEKDTADLVNKVRSINQVRVDDGLDEVDWGEAPVGKIGEMPYDPEGFTALQPDVPSALGEEDPERSGSIWGATFGRDGSPRVFSATDVEWQRQVAREKTFVPPFQRAMRLIFREQLASVLHLLEAQRSRAISAKDLIDEKEWKRLFEVKVEPVRVEAFQSVMAESLVSLGGEAEFVFTGSMQKMLAKQGAQLVTNTTATTKKRLTKLLQKSAADGDSVDSIARKIRAAFETRIKTDARTIARTEILKSTQSAQLEAFDVMEIDGKQWHTARDGDVRDSHAYAEGQIVFQGESFDLAGEAADAPGVGAGGGALSAANSINCRCFVTPVREIN